MYNGNSRFDTFYFYPTIELVTGTQLPTVDPATFEDSFTPNFPSAFFIDVEPSDGASRIVGNAVSFKVEYEFIKTAATQAITNTCITTYGNWGSKAYQNKVMNGYRIHTFNWASTNIFYFRPFFFRQPLGTGYNITVSDVAYSAELFKLI